MNKAERQKLIYKIIDENTVSTQEELVKLLNEQGANVTQATMSRDFKKMRITKVMLTDGTNTLFPKLKKYLFQIS